MLQLEHVTYRVSDEQGEKTILKDVNLSLSERFVAFTGPNGGGKSTLAKVIAGIITPTEGKILFDGEDITSLSVTERAKRGISYAFQQPVRFKGLTVRSLLELAAGEKLSEETLCGLLGKVGLCANEYMDREMNAGLSGGEIKRIEIATVLARRAKLSIFDEPEAALSPMRQMAMLTAMHRLTRAGSQLVVATHSPILMAYPESVIYLLDGGGIRQVGYEETDHYRVTRDFLNRYPALLRVLLEEPAAGRSGEDGGDGKD